MKIVDAQVHLWYPNTPERPWPPAEEIKPIKPHRDRQAFVLSDLLAEMENAGIYRAIITPPAWEGDYNDKAIEAAQLYPDRFAVVGRFPLNDPLSKEKLSKWKEQSGMLGVRLTFSGAQQQKWLEEGMVDWFWPIAENIGLCISIYVPGNLPSAKKIAEQYPDLKLIIDHMACPRGSKDDNAFKHIDELCKLARFPNIALKVGSLPCYSNEPYPHPKIHKYIRKAHDAFGPERLFWASDLTRLPCSYALCKTMFMEEMKWLTVSDLELIMGLAVCKWLNWPM